MPAAGLVRQLLDLDAKEPLCEREQPIQNPRQWEIGPQLLVREVEPLLSQTLCPEGDVPVGQRLLLSGLAGKGFQLLPVLPRERLRCRQQLVEHPLHGIHIGRHFGGQAQFGVRGVSQKVCALFTQLECALDQRRIVQLALRGTGDIGPVEFLALIAIAAMLEKRSEAGVVQRDPPWAVLRRTRIIALTFGLVV